MTAPPVGTPASVDSGTVVAGMLLTLGYISAILLSRNYPAELGTWQLPSRIGDSYQWIVCMTVLPAAVAALLLTDRVRWPSKRARLLGWLLGLAVVGEAVSALTSATPIAGLSSYVLPHLALWLLFTALVSTPWAVVVRWLVIGLILAAALQSLVAFYQGLTVTLPTLLGLTDSPHRFVEADDVKWTRFPPAFGLTAWPTILAALLAVILPLCFLFERRVWRVAVLGLLSLGLLLSFGRSAWLGLAMASFVGGTIWLLRGRTRTWAVGVAFALLGCVALAGLQPRAIDRISERLPIAPAAASRGERELAQDVALGLWKRQPLFGVGSGNSARAARSDPEFANIEERIVPAHNWFVLSLAERGVAGALPMALLWAGPLVWLMLSGAGRTDAVIAASFTALAVSQWFDYELTYWIGGSLLQTVLLALYVRSATCEHGLVLQRAPGPERDAARGDADARKW